MWYHSNFWWLDDMQDVRKIGGGGGLIEHREHLYACSIHSIITVRL